jgi:glycosyltransferase involved in cell wall biosynthesis
MQLIIFINSFGAGGAERAMSILSRGAPHEFRKIYIIILINDIFYNLPDNSEIIHLLSVRGFFKILKIILNRKVSSTLVSNLFWSHLVSKFLSFFIKTSKNIAIVHSYTETIGFRKLIIKFLYSKSSIFFVSTWVKDKFFKITSDDGNVIGNPINFNDFNSPNISLAIKNILWVGRIDKNKNPIKLINDFFLLSARQKYNLTIIGDGPLRNNVQNLIKTSLHIKYVESVSSIDDLYKNQDALIITSHYETWGYTAVEATISGLHVFSYKNGGVQEVLGDNEFILEKDKNLFEQMECYFINNNALEIIQSRREHVMRFDVKKYCSKIFE